MSRRRGLKISTLEGERCQNQRNNLPGNPSWKVDGRYVQTDWTPSDGQTGGHFSNSYIVESRTGQRAFLKALDFTRALRDPYLARALKP